MSLKVRKQICAGEERGGRWRGADSNVESGAERFEFHPQSCSELARATLMTPLNL